MRELVKQYVEDMKSRNLSKNTREAYSGDILQFEEFLQKKGEKIESVDNVTIMAYVQMLNSIGKANSSIVRNIVAVRNFYKFLIRLGMVEKSPVIEYDMPKVKRNAPEILTVDEINELLTAPDESNGKGIRDKAMLELMYATGIKISEMLDLDVSDVNLKLKYIKCRGIKGKERIIPIGSYAVLYLEKYLCCRDELNINKLSVLFLNSQGQKMTRQGFWKIVKWYSGKANINKDITLNTLRHSFAVHLLENGADMKSLQELLGHTDIAAAQMYLNLMHKNRLVEVYNNAHPRA